MKTDIKKGFIITYYHSSEMSLNLLIENLKTISRENYYLVLASHSPLDKDIQDMCDFYFYQQKNIVDNKKYSHGVAESNLIEISLKHLKEHGIEWTYKVSYDIQINDVCEFKRWDKREYNFVSCNWGDNIICTNSFFANINFLLENITFYRTIDQMFSVNTVLENCWEYDFRNKNLLDQIYSFKDKQDFYGVNKIDILYYDYSQIEFWYSEEEGRFYISSSSNIENSNLKIFDYYTDLCIYNDINFSINSGSVHWIVPPFFNNGINNKNGYYLEVNFDGKCIRKNILISDFDLKHTFYKKFLSYKNENVNFLFGYLNDFEEIYTNLNFGDIRNFVDLGANYGISSIFFMERDIKCYLVDADSRMIKLLGDNYSKNSNNKVIHTAIYSYDGEIEFFEDSDCSMVSSISAIDANNKVENRNKSIVNCITPNTLISDFIDEDFIDLIKIDIEGAEYGLFDTITDENLLKINNLLIEYHNNDDYKILNIIKKLTTNKYKFKFIGGGYPIEEKGGLIYAWK